VVGTRYKRAGCPICMSTNAQSVNSSPHAYITDTKKK
jgi:hypothetical protein